MLVLRQKLRMWVFEFRITNDGYANGRLNHMIPNALREMAFFYFLILWFFFESSFAMIP